MNTNELLRVNLTPQTIIRWGFTVLCTLLLFAQLSFAQDLSARFLADYGNVTVMEATGNFDENTPEGVLNSAPRQAVAREFFRTHKDEYDFVTILTNFDIKIRPDAVAFYSQVKNDIRGIGQQIYDNSALYGSNGKLQGTIDMGNLLKLATNPLDPKFNFTVDTMVHEMLHRWGAYVKFKDWNGTVSDALLGQDKAHWSFLLDSAGSTLYGNKWKDNGNGTFTSTAVRKYYSPLDLYVMGMIDKSKVPPTLQIDNPAIDPAKMPAIGDTISGTAHYVNVDDIIAVQDQGERVPNARDSQKQFKMAFIYVVSPGTFKSDDLYGIENIRNAYLTRFSILTDGKGLVQVTSTPKDDLPTNPGVRPPTAVPRTLPPSIDNGVTWLMNRQQADGSWTDFVLTTERDTAESVTTLQHFPVAAQSSQAGFAWLGNNSAANTDYLARRIEAAVQAGSNSSALVQELLARLNRDGGWGSNRNFISNATDTALALKALAVSGYSNNYVTGTAIAYLQGTQNADGGWSGDDAFSTIQPTAAVLTAFNFYRNSTPLDANLTKAVAFLAMKQNADGGFGNSPSTVYDSALSVVALQAAGADKTMSGRGVDYLLGQQSENGAWFDSPYQTALAVRAVWATTVDPDLSIKPEDISVIPATITTIPTNAVLSATVWNLGRNEVSQGKVAVYDGIVAPDKKVAEQTVAFPGQSPVTLTFSIPVTDSTGHVFHMVVDPDNHVVESNKNNNSALKSLMPEITYDLQVLTPDITVTPNPADIGKDVKIAVKMHNSGTSDAYNVPVRIFINQPGAPLEIATLTVDLPAGGSAVKETTWKASLAGVNLPLTVQIDPSNTFTETNKDNNSASVPLTVNASTLPNLSVSYKDMVITPSPAREGSNASISVLVKNDGYSAVENIKVSVYNGTVSNGGTLLGSQVVPAIAVGQSARTAIDWSNIPVNGGQLITVQVDPENAIQEITKEDNFTFLNLDVLSLPDLAISTSSIAINPATPKSGDTVTIVVTVQNGGEQEAHDVTVQATEGGATIGSTIIPLVNGNSQAFGTISYDNAGLTGTHQITASVNPGNLIVERSKDNNSAVKTFSIQDANLWLTEPYISPNGDGIKDSTDFSFRLTTPSKVSVQVINKNGVAVRTFNAGELDNTPGTTVTWDGKNDVGVIVPDGDYQIRVVTQSNALLATLPVIVDNNQSPLADAIGTRYLLQNNMTCQVPANFWEWGWSPHDSGVWFKNDYTMQNFPSGFYKMAPNGDDIHKITPEDWSDSNNDYSVDAETVTLNSDGTKIAFAVWKYERSTNRYLGGIWEQASDGSGRRELAGDMELNIGKLKWSPDSKQIVFAYGPLSYWGYNAFELRIAHTEPGGITIVDGGYPYWYNDGVFWSPDSRSLAYSINTHCNADKSYCHQDYETLKVGDVNGATRVVHTSTNNIYSYANMRWLADGMLLAEEYPRYEKTRLLLFDTINQPPPRTVQNKSEYPANRPVYDIHPDQRSIALITQQKSGTNLSRSLNMIGLDGSVVTVGDMGIAVKSYVDGPTDDPVVPLWSQAGDKLAYVERELRITENKVYENLVIYDRASSDSKKYPIAVSNAPVFNNYSGNEASFKVNRLIAWLSDKVSILVDTVDGYFSVNTEDGTISSDLPIEREWDDPSVNVSPDQRYITYLQHVDPSGACAKQSGQDIWTISSLLNLTADLRITKNKSVVKLKGIASDKNFAGYKLEYADIKTPASWNFIMPPSDVPVANDKFTDWVPPNEGSFLVRLTVSDKAGNLAIDLKRVAWGISTLVSGLYRDNEFIAPKNTENPKKTVALHYTALDAVHLEFAVVNDKGETVRSFAREHAGYTVDSIIWDGKDEVGNFVPDGKYTVKLFDYEFGVEVDNTLPTVAIGLSGITYDYKQLNYFVKLTASSADRLLKKWTIQAGTGENPLDWSTVASGADNIPAYVQDYINGQIAFLKLKRFRIVAEDFAGNQSIAVSHLLENKVVFAGFVSNNSLSILPENTNSILLNKGVQYSLAGFETLSASTQKVVLQFSGGSGWQDVQEQTDGDLISFSWQHPENVTKPYGLRFKVVTTYGSEHYSKIVSVNEEFSASYACEGLLGKNYLFEKLQQLDVKVTAGTGESLSQSYTDSNVPTGVFLLLTPNTPDAATGFSVSMNGTGFSGKTYSFSRVFAKPPCKPPTDKDGGGDGDSGDSGAGVGATASFDVIYPEALACGKTSGEIQLPTERLSLAGAKRVAYLVKVGTTQQVIGDVDLEFEGPRRVSLDSSLLPSGSYPLSVILTNTDNTQKQTDLGKVVVFDTDAPQAQLILPASPCPVRTVTSKGTRQGIELSGNATDNIKVARYALYYGIGENPTTWSPAVSVGSDGVGKPIAGDGAVLGRLATWDITDIPGSVFTLKMEVVDAAGNKGCATGVVRVDRDIKISGYNIAPFIFSPNNDGIVDTTAAGFSLDEPATLDLSAYSIAKDAHGTDVLGALQRRVLAGLKSTGGSAIFDWNGIGDSNAVLPENRYGVSLTVTDTCGNTATQWKSVELDNTPPVLSIDYPLSGNPLPPGVMIEIKGTATDLNFKSYLLEAGEGDSPTTWRTLASSDKPVSSAVIVSWNTFGLTNRWTLRLTAEDTVGNRKGVTSTIDLGVRKELVKSLDATPKLFSPNNDQKLETSIISYEVTDACNLKIDILDGNGQVVRTFTAVATAAGNESIVWDGKNSLVTNVPDGIYTIRLTASLAARPEVNQTETISLTVDTTPPAITLADLADKSYLNRTDLSVTGTINDANLVGYNITMAGSSGTAALDNGIQNRANYSFGRIADLSEDTYTLTVDSQDLGQNQGKLVRTITIDRTPPNVTLVTPRVGEFYGNSKNVIDISGAIVDKNLDRYGLRYGVGETPIEWKEVAGGDTVPTLSKLYSWKVGKDDGIADGLYTLSLYAKDKAGLEGETKVKVVVDNTPPEVAFTLPKDGGYLAKATDIKGTLNDANLDTGLLKLSEGGCATAAKWAVFKTVTTSVQNGVLDSWKLLPADGEYCLRLTATDKSGNKAETQIDIKIDTHPPTPPQISGKTENKTTNSLSWVKSPETDVASYNVYRTGQKLNTVPITTELVYSDADLKEGSYIYTVRAVDLAGNESDPSNTVTLKIDLTGPSVRIATPKEATAISNLVDIKGTAYSQDDFKEYRVYIGQGSSPSSWSLIRKSPLPISYGSLAQWDTISNQEGTQYTLKLEGEDTSGNISTTQAVFTIDNTPPGAPVLESSIGLGSDVALTWKANTESDLAGYLLYRDDQLANVKGIVAGNLKPYMVIGTGYTDKALPDGTYRYYLVAMDQAGNSSDQSNSQEVTIDTHPPHMTILDPQNGQEFQSKIAIKAESPDTDIATVQFQYKLAQDASWSNLGASFAKAPFIAYLDPKALNLAYGNYQIQAVAVDKSGKPDPLPSVVAITHIDLTPPAIPASPSAKVNGADIALTWDADTEADLDGYNIYRWNGGSRTRLNGVIVKNPGHLDAGVPDGNYSYEITAIDVYGNESKPSGQVAARIYAPLILQPYTPLKTPSLVLHGSGVDSGSSVEISVTQAGSGTVKAVVAADQSGLFSLEAVTLSLGENRFTAIATDSAGNVSRRSETVVVVYDEQPAPPTGLAASVTGYGVSLAWNGNSEPDIIGYSLFRDGEKVNDATTVTGGQATASYQDYYSMPQNAIDGNYGSYWGTSYGYGEFTPAWWQMTLPVPELINRIDINWQYNYWDYDNNKPVFLGGKDYEVQAWSGYNWITLKKVVGNDQQDNTIYISPSYRTDRIRLFITATTDPDYSKFVRIQEIRFTRENLIPTTDYLDTGLLDHRYSYSVTAVDKFGFESGPSTPVTAAVGDVEPPGPPLDLAVTVQGSDVVLSWNPPAPAASDLAEYHVFRETPTGWMDIGFVPPSNSSYEDQHLANGTYRYRVTAKDLIGNESTSSNEVSAIVRIEPPPVTSMLTVSAPPSGGALDLAWQAPAGNNQYAYFVYRSLSELGPFNRVTSSRIYGEAFRDNGLVNGTTYYYRVTATDWLDNEGEPGNVAWGIPLDRTAVKPAINSPTIPGIPFVTNVIRTTVGGFAEPAAQVEIMRDTSLLGRVTASQQDVWSDTPIELYTDGATLSPDGQILAYVSYGGQLQLRNRESGETVLVPSSGFNRFSSGTLQWSPDGRFLLVLAHDYSYKSRIALYDRDLAQTRLLTNGETLSEWGASWSPAGDFIVFAGQDADGVNGIWKKGLDNLEATLLSGNINADYLRLSPSGDQIAFFDNSDLNLLSTSDSSVSLVDDNTDYWTAAWSPDGSKLVYVSYRGDSNGEFYVFSTADRSITRLTYSGLDGYYATWSPDSSQLAYATWSNTGETVRIVQSDGREREVGTSQNSIVGMEWRRNGELLFIDSVGLHNISPAGMFNLPDVQLVPGENRIVAVSTDASSNRSEPSEAISVVLDTGMMPDLVMTGTDITFFPPYPKPGEDVIVTARVHNPTTNPVDNATIELYLWDGSNDVVLLTSEIITHLDAYSEASVSTRFNAGTAGGTRTVIAVVDPVNLIPEVLETNNYASKDLIVTDQEKVTLTSSLNATQYAANQELIATVKVRNSGLPKAGMLSVAIEDASGNPVKLLTTQSTELPYGADKTQAYEWNTLTTFSGSYRLHATISDGSTVLAEGLTPFTIMPDLRVSADIVTDRQQYGSHQDVSWTASFKNTGVNYLIPQLRARVRVLGNQNTELYSGEQTVANLMTGASGSLSYTWNTGFFAPGPHTAALDIFVGDKLVTSSSANFSIIPSVSIGGSIKADPAVAVLGSSFTANYTLTNDGNVGASGTAQVSLIDQDTSTVVATTEQATILPLGSTVLGNATFTADGLKLKNYLLKLNFLSNGNSTVITTTPLSVKDGTPPVLTVSTLADGSFTVNNILNIAGTVTDNVGVKKLLINDIPVPYGLDGKFSHALLLKPGENRVAVRATDLAGNPASDSRTIIQDQKAPVLAVTSPADNSKTNKQQIDVTGHVDETSIVEVRVNGVLQLVTMDGNNFTATVTLLPGAAANTIDITATNLAMKSSSDKRSVYYDDQAPALAITTPGQDIHTNQANLTIHGTASDPYGFGVTVSLDMNGQKFTPQLIDGKFDQAVTFMAESTYHIVATATNEMDTSTSVQRNVIYDVTPPNISIDPVVSPINQQTQLISGTRETDAEVTVSCATTNVGPVEYPAGTTWKASLGSLAVGDNSITVTATDGAGNPNSVSVHIIYDSIPPTGSILINNGAGFTAVTQVAINLSAMDDNGVTSMRLSNDGITWTDPEGYATTRIWNLLPGDGQKSVYVQYKDPADNWSADPIVAHIVLDTALPRISAVPAGGTYNATQSVQLTVNEAAILYYTTNGSIPTTSSAVYSGPLAIVSSTLINCLAVDSAGNLGTYSASYVIDTIPPIGTITINAGATMTNSTQVTLTLAASDDSGVSKMRFSNDNSTWSDPENYTTSRNWFLSSGEGSKQVFVSYQDLSGNWSAPIEAPILLDASPPMVSATPAGGIFNTTQEVKLTANEAATIYYTTDGSTPTTSSAVYGGLLTIAASTTLNCLAIDSSGNRGTHTESYFIDTIPPFLNISALPNGSYTNNEVLNVSGRVTDNIGVKELLINGAPVPFDSEGKFSQVLVLNPGENKVNIYATDLATNPTSDNRTINLDQKAPLLTITDPSDNIMTNKQLIDVKGYVDEPNTTVEVNLKGVPQAVARDGNNFTATVALVPGADPNTIDIKASDLATNGSSDKRSVYYDDKSPALAITVPQQDIRTNLSNLTIHGTASDAYGFGVAVSIDMNGQNFVPSLIDGKFEQTVTFATEGIYNIVATATNEAHSSTSVPRNVIYDVTPPALTINAVTSPTTANSQTVSGTMESGLVVTVASSTAAIGTATYPTATTWQVPVNGLTAGSNIITASVVDNANNTSTVSREIVYSVSTSSGIFSAAIFANSKVTMTGGSYTDSYINCPSSWVRGRYRNGDVGTNSLQPCGVQMSGGSQVFGKAWVGHGGIPATGVCMSGGSSVSGGAASLAVARDMAPKMDPAGGTAIGAITLSGHGARNLTAGDYRVSSITLSGGSTLTLNGPLTLHVDGNLSLSGNSNIVIASGAVTIYQNGRKLDISGGAIVNTGKLPANLTIYGTAGLQTMNLSGGSDLHALVYAPTAAVKLSGGQNTFGSVIGNTVDISGGSSVHYDESMRN